MNTLVDGEGLEIDRLPVNSEEQTFNEWQIKYEQSHILHSQCSNKGLCNQPENDKCLFCFYSDILSLPHLPDMVFPKNKLYLIHSSGNEIVFNALDALKIVSSGKSPLQVCCAEAWQESRSDMKIEEKAIPFDWTFSTDYKGTLRGFTVEPTEQRIDIDKLREKEKILFYHELTLFEDELHDHGIASLSVKIRVMPSSFFVLLRYFLRVDNVLVKVKDTRIFHEFGTSFLLREHTERESEVQKLNLPLHIFTDPNAISYHLPLILSCYEKIQINSST